ncbi:MAG TPA: CpsD/CapB family tyrosine-protein kinase [Steroidobacteraceae bacterium]|jgi:protein-tyrosine kinase|nr:CpsD/CapB family tyrosine-protein kinase [Steroidobacteraceae bacterium]
MNANMDKLQRALDLAAIHRPTANADEVAVAERTAVRREFTPPPMEPARRLAVDWTALRENRVVDWADRRPAAQAYRMLRTQVLQRARSHHLSTIGVISAANGEGKTLTAINLALGLAAEPNQSVMLMDLDLKRPSIARTLGLALDQGLESWFAGIAKLEDLWCGLEGAERLFVLPTLHPVPDSSEALARVTTTRMFQDLKERDPGRLMIVDLPPVLLSDDAITLAPSLDAVVLVVTEGRTRREDVSRVLELLGNTRVIGTVLNRSTESEKRAY